MTKSELVAKIQEVYSQLDELQGSLVQQADESAREVRRLMRVIEDIPEEPSEITDEEKEETE